MAGFEQTIIIGNVGNAPEMRYLQSGMAVCNFSVAVTTRWTDSQTGEKREKTKWYRCNAWATKAEILNEYLNKGSQVMIKGTPEAKAYIGNDGEAKATLELRVDDFQFLGGTSVQPSVGSSSEYDPATGKVVEDIPF